MITPLYQALGPLGWKRGAPGVHPRWDNLVAGWHLDEESDGSVSVPRLDVLGVRELTDNNTVKSTPGKLGNAALFVAGDAEHFSLASPSFPSWAAGLTLSFWHHQTSGWSVVSHDDGGSQRSFAWTGGVWYCFQSNSVFQSVNLSPQLGGGNTTDFVVLWWDPADGKVYGSVNNGSPLSSAGTITGVQSVSAPFYVNRHISTYTSGWTDELGIFSEVKDAAWRTDMYNAGAGHAYPN